MDAIEIREIINAGETSRVQFKQELKADDLVAEIAGKVYAERQTIEETNVSDVDLPLFRSFYQKKYNEEFDSSELNRLMTNLRLLKDNKLTLVGALLFGENTEILLPYLHISVIWFWGKDFITDDYRSSENIAGNLRQQYKESVNFVLSTLKKVQGEQNFNSLGIPEIPKLVLEELLINALVHRDYFIHDSIKLFIFEDRIEIKSPGKLPNNLSVEDIKQGIQRRSRNIVLTSFVSDVLPYRGIGSGILKITKSLS